MDNRPTRASPLRSKYLVRNGPGFFTVRAMDVIARIVPSPNRPPIVEAPRKILITTGGHLGDTVVATSVLPVLKQRFPDVRIGMATGSWSDIVLKSHPAIEWIHHVDHWKVNRSGSSLPSRIKAYRRSVGKAISEVSAVGYDVAIDLYPFFPNFSWFLWKSRIPVRVGYESGGLGRLYTHALSWVDSDRHTTAYHLDLLRVLDGLVQTDALRPHLAPIAPTTREHVRRQLASPDDYLVLHPGSGSALKEWEEIKWRALAEGLIERGAQLVFTGANAAETDRIGRITEGLSGCLNLSGRLHWDEFRAVVEGAKAVICVDSVIGHLASAAGTPCLVLMAGMSNSNHWRPAGRNSRVLSQPLPCSPCYLSRGCESMECIRGIGVGQVLETLDMMLGNAASSLPRAGQS